MLSNVIGEEGIKTEVGINQPDIDYLTQKIGIILVLFFGGTILVISVASLIKQNAQ